MGPLRSKPQSNKPSTTNVSLLIAKDKIDLDMMSHTSYTSRFERSSGIESKIREKILPSLVDQIEIVKGYWKVLDEGRMDYEIPAKKVAKLLVSK